MGEERKSIVLQLNDIATQICDKYCKYPEQWDEEKEGIPLTDGPCGDCPLTRWLL